MSTALGCDVAHTRAGYTDLTRRMAAGTREDLKIVNRMYIARGFHYRKKYGAMLAKRFRSAVEEVEFGGTNRPTTVRKARIYV